jgi:hypothetical protein
VLIDQEQCRGYRKCVEACPYKKSMYRGNTRTSEKCIACYPRVEGKDPESDGQPLETRCMAACIGQIRMQGLVKTSKDGTWAEDRHNPLYYMVHVAKVALPLYPQFGTSPNGYYIPPRWVPVEYLHQMFGPGVEQAIERYANPDRELLAVLQLFRRSNRIIYRYELQEGPKLYEASVNGKAFTVYNDTVISYGRDGQELFRAGGRAGPRAADKHQNSMHEHRGGRQARVCRSALRGPRGGLPAARAAALRASSRRTTPRGSSRRPTRSRAAAWPASSCACGRPTRGPRRLRAPTSASSATSPAARRRSTRPSTARTTSSSSRRSWPTWAASTGRSASPSPRTAASGRTT